MTDRFRKGAASDDELFTSRVSSLGEEQRMRSRESSPADGGGYFRAAAANVDATIQVTGEQGKTRARGVTPTPPPDVVAYKSFRRTCDEILVELLRAPDFLDGDVIGEHGSGIIAEVENLLEALYECPWGKKEALKRAVVLLQSQVSNLRFWERKHVEFLADAIRLLRISYVIDEGVISDLLGIIKAHGLDRFRGTAAAPGDVGRKYRTIEVTPE